MTDKLYVGTQADCDTVRTAVDFVMDFPVPPTSGQFAVNEATRVVRVAEWFAMTQAQRDAIISNPVSTGYEGWTLQFSGVYEEYLPGTRKGCFLPGNIAALVATASQLGRTLSIQQTLALTAAQATWLDDFPANWITPPP